LHGFKKEKKEIETSNSLKQVLHAEKRESEDNERERMWKNKADRFREQATRMFPRKQKTTACGGRPRISHLNKGKKDMQVSRRKKKNMPTWGKACKGDLVGWHIRKR